MTGMAGIAERLAVGGVEDEGQEACNFALVMGFGGNAVAPLASSARSVENLLFITTEPDRQIGVNSGNAKAGDGYANPEPSRSIANRRAEGAETRAEETIMPTSAPRESEDIVRYSLETGSERLHPDEPGLHHLHSGVRCLA